MRTVLYAAVGVWLTWLATHVVGVTGGWWVVAVGACVGYTASRLVPDARGHELCPRCRVDDHTLHRRVTGRCVDRRCRCPRDGPAARPVGRPTRA